MADSELRENPAYQLWLATNAWQRTIRRALVPLDLTFVQFTVLSSIHKLNQPLVSQADICRFAIIDPNMASSVVRSLVDKGFIERHPHPSDRRAHSLQLTATGHDLLVQARALLRPKIQEFFEPLGDERLELARMLRTLALQGQDEEP